MIIGLSGYAGSGKDEVAKTLIEEYGFTRIAFADKIRELVYEMNPLVGFTADEPCHLRRLVDDDDWDTAKKNHMVRKYLQDLGVGARKVFGEQFWVHEAMKTMLNDPRPDMKYVITDVRFFNEADMVKANQGQIWRVERPEVEAVNSHISEHALDDWKFDQVINNGGSIEELTNLVRTRIGPLLDANQIN